MKSLYVAVLAGCFSWLSASADPLPVLTATSAQFMYADPIGSSFSLSGPGFSFGGFSARTLDFSPPLGLPGDAIAGFTFSTAAKAGPSSTLVAAQSNIIGNVASIGMVDAEGTWTVEPLTNAQFPANATTSIAVPALFTATLTACSYQAWQPAICANPAVTIMASLRGEITYNFADGRFAPSIEVASAAFADAPEPSSMFLMFAGCAALAAACKVRSRARV
ncbi:MAG: PEP-CTERM sorting domain-containing protein [Acidobacteriaceae bacterium]|nr:PEP-CTERM sorting domain-containing protein [Acidobacteriaceae bacterium]